ncbi:DNA invertase Pin-like site-specific DNA recombinase [Aeromicrobium panaciterrae]|uniref:DNA invertase Pin-like site-specific DNA recombinase n=1 Tax=Aeromicrobium panaciterrae TaxID=363861 RepID=A0ABU1UNS2_9ACTN|nr:recombinase family protein [Aeromicrobium panaciterrae]MDR7086832.1 DNA invertase Pin-like site-specific DNA recombinase [Aeromicrobium panaciterrae]
MGQDGLLIGYARCSTDEQDLQAQRDGLIRLGVPADRIYMDHGRTGSNRDRPGLREAMAAVRDGDTLVVTKLDRLARSVKDAAELVEELTESGARLSIAGSIHDPADPVGKLLFNVLSMVAEFERDLIRARTREGMAVARARGRLKGRQPKLSQAQQRQVIRLMDEGEQTPTEIGELFGVSRQTVYRLVAKAREGHAA